MASATLFLPKHSLPRELNYLMRDYTHYVSDLDIWKHISISGRGWRGEGARFLKIPAQTNEMRISGPYPRPSKARWDTPGGQRLTLHFLWVPFLLGYFIFQFIPLRALYEPFFEGILFSFFCSLSPKPPGQFRSGCMANERFTAASSVGTVYSQGPVYSSSENEYPIWSFSLAQLLRQ